MLHKKSLLSLAAMLSLCGFASGAVTLSTVDAPLGEFSSSQTVQVTVSNGDMLLIAYGDDAGGSAAYTSVSFNNTSMTSVFGGPINEGNTSSDLLYFSNNTGSDITADVVVDSSRNPFFYGIYTVANVDLSNPFGTPVTNTGNFGSGGGAEDLDLSLTGLEAGEFVLSIVDTGDGGDTLSISDGSIIQTATDGGGGGTMGLATWTVDAAGDKTLTWSTTDNPWRMTGGAVVINQIPEPSSAVLLLGSLGALLLLRRRRA